MKAQGVGGTPCPSHHGWIFPGYCLTRVRAWGTKTRVRMLKRPVPRPHGFSAGRGVPPYFAATTGTFIWTREVGRPRKSSLHLP